MKTLKLPFGWLCALLLQVVFYQSCVPSATSLHSSASFSNIRSEIRLTDGTVLRGYASMNALRGENALRVRVAGEKNERTIPLSKVERLLAEEHEFVVKMLETPVQAKHGGKPAAIRAMVKRMGMEHDAIQVYEYKYPVSNPKSPISNVLTAWYVSFPGDPAGLPLCELNSNTYKQKWAKIAAEGSNPLTVQAKAPGSVKGLLEQVKKLPTEQGAQQNFGAAE